MKHLYKINSDANNIHILLFLENFKTVLLYNFASKYTTEMLFFTLS